MTAPRVSVVIVSYGTRELTLAALESVRQAGRRVDLEAVVVDNASPDGSADAVAAAHAWAALIRSPRNLGFAAAANLGAAQARGEWLLFLNSDARLLDDSLPRLLEAAAALPSPGALGPRIEGPDGPERSIGHFFGPRRDLLQILRLYRLVPGVRALEGVYRWRLPAGTERVEWISGACLLVLRSVFLDLGGFDEAFFLYVEDMDLCYRLDRGGRVNLFVPGAVVRHELGASPRDPGLLLEGGDAPEYFVRKHGLRYPWWLQRSLRILGTSVWLAGLSVRASGLRLAGKDAGSVPARARLARRSLAALLRRGRPRLYPVRSGVGRP